MIIFAWLPIWLAAKSYAGAASGFVLRSRTAQIAVSVLLVLMLGRCAWGHYEGVKEDLRDAQDELVVIEGNLGKCQDASRTQQDTIARLELAEADNTARYQAEINRSERMAARIRELESANEGERQDDIRQAIDEGATDCGLEPMPDALQLRVTP